MIAKGDARNEFCTIVNTGYVPRAIALYRSLEDVCGDFRLRVLCLDADTKRIFDRLALSRLDAIALSELEENDPEFGAVRPTRTEVEYAWTAIPTFTRFVLHREPKVEMITRLDADLMFFANPAPLFDELGRDSVLIIPHRFAPRFESWAAIGGVFNTEFETFRRDSRGLAALDWWRDRCIEWCYDRADDTRWGDQKYLDDWPERFAGVHVLEHPGGGLAPWNSEVYRLESENGRALVDGRPLIFYHHQSLRLYWGMTTLRRLGVGSGRYRISAGPTPLVWAVRTEYSLSEREVELVWNPYLRRLAEAIETIRSVEPGFPLGRDAAGPAAVTLRVASRVVPARARKALRRAGRRLRSNMRGSLRG